MNVVRILADVTHTISKCILIWAIHSNKSAEGVSLLTQCLYVAVFSTRYLDLFWTPPYYSWWNFILKNFYIWSSIYIIILMTFVYARTREREKAWKLSAYATVGSLLAAPLVYITFNGAKSLTFSETLWAFSIILESVCVLPQLLLLRQTTVPTVIDSYYLVTLGSYRALYIVNWIVRGATEHFFDPIVVIFGIIQTAFYVDFAWVYWTRQRVKLRRGGLVDSEDLRKGWLVNRVIPSERHSADLDEEEGSNVASDSTRRANRWGVRGVSVSADDTLDEHQGSRQTAVAADRSADVNGSASLADEDDGLFSDGEDDAMLISGHQRHDVTVTGGGWSTREAGAG